jgi:hypothetical protein
MPRVSKLFFRTAIIWLVAGLAVGFKMGISGNHDMIPAHTHINLLGWVTSALFALYYNANRIQAFSRMAMVHLYLYSIGTACMVAGLALEELGVPDLEPVIGIGATILSAGVFVFAFNVLFGRSESTHHG